jgi:hypothetical protein
MISVKQKSFGLFILSNFFLHSLLLAQGDGERWSVNGSLGFGYSSITNMPGEIFQQGSENLQLGVMVERELSTSFSLVSLVELDFLEYSFDGLLTPVSDSHMVLELAPDGLKYPGILQKTLSGSVLGRVYLKRKTFNDPNCIDGSCVKEGRLFLQTGIRVSRTTDFLGLNYFDTRFVYRANNMDNVLHIGEFINQTMLQFEASVGVKGQYDNLWSILNSSTIGVIFQLTPVLNQSSVTTELNPLHLSWRFYF